jgi:hypothetical protein
MTRRRKWNWAAIFNGLLVVVGVWTLIATERAYLSIGLLELKKPRPYESSDLVIPFTIKNAGKTTGFIKEIFMMSWVTEIALPERPVYTRSGRLTVLECPIRCWRYPLR